jgi:hypothetical protein
MLHEAVFESPFGCSGSQSSSPLHWLTRVSRQLWTQPGVSGCGYARMSCWGGGVKTATADTSVLAQADRQVNRPDTDDILPPGSLRILRETLGACNRMRDNWLF